MDRADEAETLRRGACELGVDLTETQLGQLCDYAAMVRRWNGKFNLVSRRDMDRFVARHLLDSLSIAPLLRGPNVLDLGTGAGLPGIPLAVARPELHLVLLDRGERKIRFLRQVVREAGLANVSLRCQDARDATDLERFATIVTRAVTGPAEMWRLAEPILNPDGVVIMLHRTDAGERPRLPTISGAVLCSRAMSVPGLAGQHEILQMRRAAA